MCSRTRAGEVGGGVVVGWKQGKGTSEASGTIAHEPSRL